MTQWLRALRMHQWVKNLLVFVPVVMAHKITNISLWGAAGQAFLAFCLCASATYLFNDLHDAPHDRHHPTKRQRPLASGHLGQISFVALIPLLVGGAVIVARGHSFALFGVLGSYILLTLSYTLFLKRQPFLDVIILAGLYVLRLFAGSVATAIPISSWLLTFSLFFFLSLALAKRVSELQTWSHLDLTNDTGRGYQPGDISLLMGCGTICGYLSIVILSLYANSPEVVPLYHHPTRLWPIGLLLLYWISRVWLLVQREKMHDDPIVFALRDLTSYVVIALVLATLWIAS